MLRGRVWKPRHTLPSGVPQITARPPSDVTDASLESHPGEPPAHLTTAVLAVVTVPSAARQQWRRRGRQGGTGHRIRQHVGSIVPFLPPQRSLASTLRDLLATTRPRDVIEGLLQGLAAVILGVLYGFVMVVTAASLAIAALCRFKLRLVLGQLVTGAVGTVCVTVGSLVLGAAQLLRGLVNTPRALRAKAEQREWDKSSGTWVEINLVSLEGQVKAQAGFSDEEDGSSITVRAAMVDAELYDLFEVSPMASAREIKMAYYHKARRCHPDTHPGDGNAKEQFQRLAEAYAVLSDPELRKLYDREGKEAVQERDPMSKIDPVVFFNVLLGSAPFEPWVGALDIAVRADGLLKSGNEQKGDVKQDEENVVASLQRSMRDEERSRRRRLQREVGCACYLRDRLDSRAKSEEAEWEQQLRLEAAELARAQRGPELLSVLSSAYRLEAERRFSLSAFTASLRRNAESLQRRFCAACAALAGLFRLEKVIRGAAKGQAKGGVGYEQRKAMFAAVERALPSLVELAWHTVVADIRSTARRVARMVVVDTSVPGEVRAHRAHALRRLGCIFRDEGLQARATAPARPPCTLASVEEALKASMQPGNSTAVSGAPSDAARPVD